MKKEIELIRKLSCVRLAEDDKPGVLSILASGIDWDYFFKRSGEDAVAGLIYRHLRFEPFKKVVPVKILEDFHNSYYINLTKNSRIAKEIKEILSVFHGQGLKAMILKGLFLVEKVYGDGGARHTGDIDLLILKEDLSRANTVLNGLGYNTTRQYQDFLTSGKITTVNTLMYEKKDANSFIHLHWHIINSTFPIEGVVNNIDMRYIWERSQPVKLQEIDAYSPSPGHLLLYLTLHIFNHHSIRQILFADIIEYIKVNQNKINWEVLKEDAKKWEVEFVLYAGLRAAEHNSGFAIKELINLAPQKLSRGEKLLLSRLPERASKNGFGWGVFFLMQKGPKRRISYIFHTLFPSRETLAHNLSISSSRVRVRDYLIRVLSWLLS